MVKVPVDTLDNIVLNQRVALMKVDIQGHESNLLEGSKVIIQRDAPHIILEFESEYSGCFKDFLEINKEILTGYRYYALQGGSNFLAEIDPVESYLNCDLLLIK